MKKKDENPFACSLHSSSVSRRKFLKTSLGALAGPLFFNCIGSPTDNEVSPRLTARPGTPTQSPSIGLSELDLSNGRNGIIYVPESYSAETPMPLFIALHGANGSSDTWMAYHARAETRGMILLAPESRSTTWDLIAGGYGPDLEFIDQALEFIFDRYNIDPMHIALAGFSDGASYALSLGISNGDLFSHLVGYSPGFIIRTDPLVGKPRVYISHGTQDSVLPITASRDAIVPAFRNADYDITYEEFEGGHQVPAEISESALDWFLGSLLSP